MSEALVQHNGKSNLPFIKLQHACGDSAEIYLQGAHVTSWQCGGQEQLFLSRQSYFAEGKAIRGGVPIIFPQFGAFGPGAKHGFARNKSWELDAQNSNSQQAEFLLSSDTTTRCAWPFDFAARFKVTLLPANLLMQLQITNTSNTTIEFTSALHTYFASPNYQLGTLSGLAGLNYWDNGTDWQQRQIQSTTELTINDALDRVYFNSTQPLTWVDQARRLKISAEGFADTVVWNPGASGAKALGDMGDDEYHSMICVEAANVANPIKLDAGAIWQGSQSILLVNSVNQ